MPMKTIDSECHAHVALDGISFSEAKSRHAQGPVESWNRKTFEAYRHNGITFIRDGGDAWGVSELAHRIAPEYGVDYRSPIFAIHRNGTYGSIVGRGFDDLREYSALVDEAARRGADFIKIMTTGIMDFSHFGAIVGGTGLELAELREMVHIAHEQGFAVMSHTNGSQAILRALEAGVDSIEHGNYLDDECITAFVESEACFVPTATVARNCIGKSIGDDDVLERIWETSRTAISRAAQAGVILAIGSDAGAVGVPHDRGAFDEFNCFVDALGDAEEAFEVAARGSSFIRSTFKRH